jgi:hypothetical protein
MLLVTIGAGLASRRHAQLFPGFVARYAGDVLWAAMVYFALALLRPRERTAVLLGIALAIAVAVELSQLWDASWLVALRTTRLGALALGQGFRWSDLVCYSMGVLGAAALDAATRRHAAAEPRDA